MRATIQDNQFSVQGPSSRPCLGGLGDIGKELKRLQPSGTLPCAEAPQEHSAPADDGAGAASPGGQEPGYRALSFGAEALRVGIQSDRLTRSPWTCSALSRPAARKIWRDCVLLHSRRGASFLLG